MCACCKDTRNDEPQSLEAQLLALLVRAQALLDDTEVVHAVCDERQRRDIDTARRFVQATAHYLTRAYTASGHLGCEKITQRFPDGAPESAEAPVVYRTLHDDAAMPPGPTTVGGVPVIVHGFHTDAAGRGHLAYTLDDSKESA